MIIPPKYSLTQKISKSLSSIEASKQITESISIPLEAEQNIRRKSFLKSSLFSARIEGNVLTLDDLPKTSSKDQKKVEVFNILKALNMVHNRTSRDLSLKDILHLHELVMSGLVDKQDLGKIRISLSAIFNAAGIAVYMPPLPRQIIPSLNRLITYANSSKESFIPIKASLSHYTFEKIHPFLDGNGRVGRLLIQAVLAKEDYGMKGLLSLEEYLDKERGEYYKALEVPERDVTDYIEFMLEAIADAAESAKNQVLQKKLAEPEDSLLPRRAEILNIIRDQKLINFDTVRRRFLKVNERTLRYDLKKLIDSGFIRKRGSTKGVYYEATKNSITSPSLIS